MCSECVPLAPLPLGSGWAVRVLGSGVLFDAALVERAGDRGGFGFGFGVGCSD